MRNIAQIRKEYMLESLDEKDIAQDPIEQFERWWDNAFNSGIDEINAMTLATVNAKGAPSARIVLLKGYDLNGFVFYSNYLSNKAKDIDTNPLVCLVFFWKELERQVRIEGIAEKISFEKSDEYFSSRPHGSQIGAWASPQSKVVPSREVLEKSMLDAEIKFAEKAVPKPDHWGGYIVKPISIEFWQGRPNRLHDRIIYSLESEEGWRIERLAP